MRARNLRRRCLRYATRTFSKINVPKYFHEPVATGDSSKLVLHGRTDILYHSVLQLTVGPLDINQVLQHFLDLGGNPNKRTTQGWTGGHVCAIRGCTVCLQV